MGILVDKIFRNLEKIYIILKGVKEGKIKSEIYAMARSSYIYVLFDMLEKSSYIKCIEERKGKTRVKKCFLTDKGGKLLELVEQLIKLDQAP